MNNKALSIGLLILGFGFLFVCMIAINYRSDIQDLKSENIEHKKTIEKYESIPNLNKKTIEFTKALNKGNFEKYLTKRAIEKIEKAYEEDLEDTHTEGPNQKINILHVSTLEGENETATSYVLYKQEYISDLDNPQKGYIDQRYLTFSLQIDWLKKGDQFKVDDFNFELINDNFDLYFKNLNKDGE